MDPVTLATITSAVTFMATEAVKGVAGEAGKDLWGKVKLLLRWKVEPPLPDLARVIAEEFQKNPEVAAQIVELLKTSAGSGHAGVLVSNVQAEKVVVAQTINVAGDFRM